MFVTLISDFEVFAKKAASLGRVKTWQTVTTVLVEQGENHVWWPALLIVHELEFESAETGKTLWTFRETVKADAENRVYTPTPTVQRLQEIGVEMRLQRSTLTI